MESTRSLAWRLCVDCKKDIGSGACFLLEAASVSESASDGIACFQCVDCNAKSEALLNVWAIPAASDDAHTLLLGLPLCLKDSCCAGRACPGGGYCYVHSDCRCHWCGDDVREGRTYCTLGCRRIADRNTGNALAFKCAACLFWVRCKQPFIHEYLAYCSEECTRRHTNCRDCGFALTGPGARGQTFRLCERCKTKPPKRCVQCERALVDREIRACKDTTDPPACDTCKGKDKYYCSAGEVVKMLEALDNKVFPEEPARPSVFVNPPYGMGVRLQWDEIEFAPSAFEPEEGPTHAEQRNDEEAFYRQHGRLSCLSVDLASPVRNDPREYLSSRISNLSRNPAAQITMEGRRAIAEKKEEEKKTDKEEKKVPEKKEKEEHNGEQCVVCMDAAYDAAFMRCGHMCCCKACADRMLREKKPCPICRAQIEAVVRIYRP